MKTVFTLFLVTKIFCIQLSAADVQKAIDNEVKTNKDCVDLGDFYWEIGSAQGKLFSGVVGKKYAADTNMKIASASKWIFGAYAIEALKDKITDEQKDFLQMRSGYTNMKNGMCWAQNANTVKACFLAEPRIGRMFRKGNAAYSAEHKGKFYYNGGHAQALAMKDELGLAELNNEQLGKIISEKLKLSGITYEFPQLAGGAQTKASTYALFLQNMINDKYVMSKSLQTEAGVCANKVCHAKEFSDSPVPGSMHWWYGNHYWIEKNPAGKVEAYSSPGLFGFYPWISADKKYYGLIARQGPARERGIKSVLCGTAIRSVLLVHALK